MVMKFGMWLFILIVHHNRIKTEQSEDSQRGNAMANGYTGKYCGHILFLQPGSAQKPPLNDAARRNKDIKICLFLLHY